MASKRLKFTDRPKLVEGRMILAFSGWMDGGDVSTGTVQRFVEQLGARQIAQIEPDSFYIHNFPGAMEVTALFRPHVEIVDGMITEFEMPSDAFYCAQKENLVFFVGKEPNLNWREFGDCIFTVASELGVTQVYFVGSFGGTVPHTREPRLYGSVTDKKLKPMLQRYGVQLSNYEGPASFPTYLMTQARRRGVQMTSLVAEIPGYVQGANPPSIAAVSRRLAAILGLRITLDELRGASNEWESRVSAAVAKDPELAQQIRKLEEQYDDELLDTTEES